MLLDKINKGIQHEPQVGVLKIELCALETRGQLAGGHRWEQLLRRGLGADEQLRPMDV